MGINYRQTMESEQRKRKRTLPRNDCFSPEPNSGSMNIITTNDLSSQRSKLRKSVPVPSEHVSHMNDLQKTVNSFRPVSVSFIEMMIEKEKAKTLEHMRELREKTDPHERLRLEVQQGVKLRKVEVPERPVFIPAYQVTKPDHTLNKMISKISTSGRQ